MASPSSTKTSNRLGDSAAVLVAEAENLPAFTRLNFAGPYRDLTAAGVRALVESPRRANLTMLDVSAGPGGAEFAELFLSPKFQLKCLESLKVSRRKLGDAGAIVLAGCKNLAGLTELDLGESNLTDAGAKAILDSPHLRNVCNLSFWNNKGLTEVTAHTILADPRPWKSVELSDCPVSAILRGEIRARCQAK